MKHVLIASVLLASLVLLGCVQQGGQKVPTVSVEAIGTPTPYVAPTAAPTAAATARPTAEIRTAEEEQSTDEAIEETDNFDAAANASGEDDVDASDLDRID